MFNFKYLYRKYFGISQFTNSEVRNLIELYRSKQYHNYTYQIFKRAKELSSGKYDFITDDFYYNKLSSFFAETIPVYPPAEDSRIEFLNMILSDFISITVFLEQTYESYKGSNIS
jgi:hypothetical protein